MTKNNNSPSNDCLGLFLLLNNIGLEIFWGHPNINLHMNSLINVGV